MRVAAGLHAIQKVPGVRAIQEVLRGTEGGSPSAHTAVAVSENLLNSRQQF